MTANRRIISTQLFQLFEAIDAQYMNLQRTVVREQDTQERLESDFLGSLWTRVMERWGTAGRRVLDEVTTVTCLPLRSGWYADRKGSAL